MRRSILTIGLLTASSFAAGLAIGVIVQWAFLGEQTLSYQVVTAIVTPLFGVAGIIIGWFLNHLENQQQRAREERIRHLFELRQIARQHEQDIYGPLWGQMQTTKRLAEELRLGQLQWNEFQLALADCLDAVAQIRDKSALQMDPETEGFVTEFITYGRSVEVIRQPSADTTVIIQRLLELARNIEFRVRYLLVYSSEEIAYG